MEYWRFKKNIDTLIQINKKETQTHDEDFFRLNYFYIRNRYFTT